jgi:hypothetical protein
VRIKASQGQFIFLSVISLLFISNCYQERFFQVEPSDVLIMKDFKPYAHCSKNQLFGFVKPKFYDEPVE